MQPITILFFALYGIASLVHLFFCFIENENARRISKLFVLPFLVCAMITLVPLYPLIWLFPLFSWIGDIILIWKKKKKRFFVFGTAAFVCGHICNLAQMIILMSQSGTNLPPIIYITYAFLDVLIMALLIPITFKKAGKIAILGSIYIPFLIFVCLFSVISVSSLPNDYSLLLTFIGYVVFIFSDCYLIFSSFIMNRKRHDFYVMLTYLIAEVLITLGLALVVI